MTSAEAAITVGELRQLVTEARAVRDAARELPAVAGPDADPKTQRWAQLRADDLQDLWDRLVRYIREGDGAATIATIRSVVAEGVPLSEPPPDLAAEAEAVVALTDILGAHRRRLLHAYVQPDGSIDPAAIAAIDRQLPAVAADLPG